MGELLSWDDINPGNGGGQGGGGGGKFLKLQAGRTYKVRPVGKPIEIWKYFNSIGGEFRSAICADPETCTVKTKYNIVPKRKYAINVIDRADGILKVMEAPVSVFKAFKEWYVNSGKNPGGKDGGNFVIKVELGPNGDKKLTKYITTFIETVPFSEDEKKMIEEKGLHKLDEIFKADSAEEIEKKLFGPKEPKEPKGNDGDDFVQKPSQSSANSQAAKKSVSADLDF